MNDLLSMRNRRNFMNSAVYMNGFAPIHHSVSNYTTDSTKIDMKNTLVDSLFINNLHLIPDPMQKPLADSIESIVTEEKKVKMDMGEKNLKMEDRGKRDFPALAGIANFISGVFSVMGGIFHKRAKSPVQYYDCCDYENDMATQEVWRTAKTNLNSQGIGSNKYNVNVCSDMNKDCKTAAAQCEDKLNQVRLLLAQKTHTSSPKPRSRPRKAFIEAGSIEESFEDAFSPEDFESIANDDLIEYCCMYNFQNNDFLEVDSPRIKTEYLEPTNIICTTSVNASNLLESENVEIKPKKDLPEQVSSCEDKISKLKELLLERRKKKANNNGKPEFIPIPDSTIQNVVNNAFFANELDRSSLSTSCESNTSFSSNGSSVQSNVLEPTSYFDEVTGKFYSSSNDTDDSFQIVFADSPVSRRRKPSDCESEDSFIIFEESPDSCYTSNEIFGDDPSEPELSDSESESDSGCISVTCKLSPSLSRTISDLTDDRLYESQDVVDHSARSLSPVVLEQENRGLLVDEIRKAQKKLLPAKKVHFSTKPPKVHVMRVWAFAARQARAGHWERHSLDRERFKRRIADVDMAVSWVLKPQHRSRVMFQRFMPWWNAQKRKELAEKKEQEDNLKEELRLEQEKFVQENSNTGTDDKFDGSEYKEEIFDNSEDNKVECAKKEEFKEEIQDLDPGVTKHIDFIVKSNDLAPISNELFNSERHNPDVSITSENLSMQNDITNNIGLIDTITNKIGPTEETTINKISPTETNTNKIGPTETNTNKIGPTETITNKIGPTETITNQIGPTETITNKIGPSETNTNKIGPTETNTNNIGPTEIITKKIGPTDTNTNKIGPTETNVDIDSSLIKDFKALSICDDASNCDNVNT